MRKKKKSKHIERVSDTAQKKYSHKNLFVQLSIIVLFFISGGTGLVYEVTWTRLFTTIFGNTTYAVSAVLTAFMGGLALGSLVLGRIADKRQNLLQLVALLEFGVGVFALLLPTILQLLTEVYKIIYQTLRL